MTEDFDDEHCPSCGSENIKIIGNTLGQDVGDDNSDYHIWLCNGCGDSWWTEMKGDECEAAKKERYGTIQGG